MVNLEFRVIPLAAAVVGLIAACGVQPIPSTPPPPSVAPPSVAPYDDGVTSGSQIFGAACGPTGASPVVTATRPVTATLSDEPQLKTFSDAVARSGLTDRLNHLVGATVFAPSDEAFARFKERIGADRFSTLMSDPRRLADLLTYHVIDKRYDRDGLLAVSEGVATLFGGTLSLRTDGNTLTVTDGARGTAKVVCGNIPAANATVFVIDRVLMASVDPQERR